PRLSFFRELQGIGKRKNRYAGVMRYVSFDWVSKLTTPALGATCTCSRSLPRSTRSPLPAHGDTSFAVFPFSLYKDKCVTLSPSKVALTRNAPTARRFSKRAGPRL